MKRNVVQILGGILLALSLLALPLMYACGPQEPEEGVEPIVLPLPLSDRIQPNFGGRLGSFI